MGIAKKLPPGQHPMIYEMENIRIRHRWTLTNLGHASGYPESTVSGWRRDGYSPSIAAFDAVLNTMGYRLKIERIPYEERKYNDDPILPGNPLGAQPTGSVPSHANGKSHGPS